jgi:molecular chaperone GrpE
VSTGHDHGSESARPGSEDSAAEEHAPEFPTTGSGARLGEEASTEGGERAEPGAVEGGVILTDMVALATERDEYRDALQRVQADFENYRKRVQRQQEEQAARAELALVGKLLDVLDTLDLAQAHLGAAEGESTEAKALSQARSMMIDTLAKEGLERVDQVDVAFDPVVHDAVAHAPAEEGEAETATPSTTMVEEVLRSGYRWRGRTLRPAMVRVRG